MKKTIIIIAFILFSGLLYSQENPAPAAEPAKTESQPAAPETQPAAEKPAAPAQENPPAQKPENAEEEKPAVQKPVATVSEEARALAQLEANPKNSEIYNRLMRIYNADGRHKERLKIALRAIQNLGGSASLYITVGDENKFLGDYAKALISYQFALRIMPTDSNIYNRMGLALLKMSNYNQAESAFKAAIYFSSGENGATRAIYVNNLGVAYEAMHDLKGAYKYFQMALRYYPAYSTAKENFTRIEGSLKSAGISPQ